MDEKIEHITGSWTTCETCKGQGRKKHKLGKKAKLRFQEALDRFEKLKSEGKKTIPPKRAFHLCLACNGSGLSPAKNPPQPDTENYPLISIIGGGIGGVALAVACLHRGIPFTLYERDNSFDERSQGYGLTLQQASKAMKGFGVFTLKDGLISTKHLVHDINGKIIGEWGARKWLDSVKKPSGKRVNVHIARQSLRLALLEQLGGHDKVQWGHQLIAVKQDEKVNLSFSVNGKTKYAKADLVVGADGIRSTIRKSIIGEETTPLQYLGCIVILGICPLNMIKDVDRTLLDAATVFQTVNGYERIYMMPYDADTIMWQLSFPMPENEAKALSKKGAKALKEEGIQRLGKWHDPIPQILRATPETKVSGYPVYDRALLQPDLLEKSKQITLIGDAAHPMSPFKGQGANQALLDALSLARRISQACRPLSNWREAGIRQTVLRDFEAEMLERSASKVKASAEAVKLLHSNSVLHEGDTPRGRGIK